MDYQMHELYMDSEMYRDRIKELEEWIVSLIINEGMRIPTEIISLERFEKIECSFQSTIPFKCPTEPAGAFKSERGTGVALETNRSPEPSYGLV